MYSRALDSLRVCGPKPSKAAVVPGNHLYFKPAFRLGHRERYPCRQIMKTAALNLVVLLVVSNAGCDAATDPHVPAPTLEPKTTSSISRNSSSFTVTPRAATVLKEVAITGRTKYCRVTCSAGGSSGFIYDMQGTNDYDESTDHLFTIGEASVVIDGTSLKRMIGTELDYVTKTKTSGFVFNNPNQKTESDAE